MNLQSILLPLTGKGLEKTGSSGSQNHATTTQDDEFNRLFGISVAQLEMSETTSPLSTLSPHNCAEAGCLPLAGQNLPLAEELLPLEDGLDLNIASAFPLASNVTPESINGVAVLPGQAFVGLLPVENAPGSVIASTPGQPQAELPSEQLGKPVSSTAQHTPHGLQSNNIISNSLNQQHLNTGTTAQAGNIAPDAIIDELAEGGVALPQVNQNSQKTSTTQTIQTTAGSHALEGINVLKQQGSGSQADWSNLKQHDFSAIDSHASRLETKADFSQLLDKIPALVNREAPASQALSSTSTLLGNTVKTPAEALYLNQHIDKPGWSQELGDRLVWLSKEGLQGAKIRLTPAHLGTIEVKIAIENDRANVSFLSQNGAVRDIIEASMPKLREMMQDAGVKLENANVSSHSNAHENKQHSQLEHARDDAHHKAQDEHADLVEQGSDEQPMNEPAYSENGIPMAIDYFA